MAIDTATPKAHPEDVGVQILGPYIFNFDTANIGSTNGVTFGTLPAGSIVLRTSAIVFTAFNAATTNVLTIGAGTTDGALLASGTFTAAVGTKGPQVGTVSGANPTTVDQVVFAKYTQTGTAATAGRAMVYVEYYPARDYAAS